MEFLLWRISDKIVFIMEWASLIDNGDEMAILVIDEDSFYDKNTFIIEEISFHDEKFSSLLCPTFHHSMAIRQATKWRLARWQLTWPPRGVLTWPPRGVLIDYHMSCCHGVHVACWHGILLLVHVSRSHCIFCHRLKYKFVTDWIIISSQNNYFITVATADFISKCEQYWIHQNHA